MMEFQPGFRFNSLTINNGRVFKNEKITLANQGIVSVLGKNAAGKSTIFNLLQVPFYGSTPTGHKKDDLCKNGQDSKLIVQFDKAGVPHNLAYCRRKKKWDYKIFENGTDQTPHTFNDSAKKAATLLGITQAEFEGSVHLTQGSQHILISGKPSKRKEYISNFFGIDNSYDQIQLAAKEELTKVKDEISKVSALSHSKTLLEQEMGLITYQDPKPSEEKIKEYENKLKQIQKDLYDSYDLIEQVELYDTLKPQADVFENPTEELKETEELLISLNTQFNMGEQIKERNQKARSVNQAIAEIKRCKIKLLNQYPDLETISLENIQTKSSELTKLKHANWTLRPLRTELKQLPDLKILPLKKIEEEFHKVQIDLGTHQRKMAAIAKGECPECGSKFKKEDIEAEKVALMGLQDCHAILKEDLEVVRARNEKAQRREYILQTIGDVREFTADDEIRLKELADITIAKGKYDENEKALSILHPQEIHDEVNLDELQTQIATTTQKIKDLKGCLEARQKLPNKPDKTVDEIYKTISDLKKKQTDYSVLKSTIDRSLGQLLSDNERLVRLSDQLKGIVSKLAKLETLKKDEFFWSKMVEAYGPKGIRIQQLNKRMDVVIRRLPVYTGILFDEKGLTFEHKCDANNIEILACREETDVDGNVVNFKHDISSFSGGEKGKLSTAFVLTLADCVPPSKRSNILILDEVDSALDADGQFRFTNDLLPMLRQNYESVFVVSHSEEIQQAAVYDQVWTVKKNNHWSSIDRIKM